VPYVCVHGRGKGIGRGRWDLPMQLDKWAPSAADYKLGKVLKQAAFDSKYDIYHLKYLSIFLNSCQMFSKALKTKSLGERISINGVGNTKISLHIILLIEAQKRIKIKNKILFNRGI